jgi:AraC-like DNA-binding protein/TolB-like protein
MNSSNSPENDFLVKLTELIEANLTNPQFGVSMLAKELEMSRSNLHRKVNSITKITVSQFINQVRLKKAKEILRHSSNTVSEIAYNVGFSNVSYFIKCFNKYYGYSPGEVGKREDDESNSLPLHTNKKWLIRIVVSALFLVILAVALILVFKPFSFNQKQQIILIAVLPFIDDSPEEGNEYIINGARREILGKLGKIKDLRVIPSSSAEKYSNSNLSISEIAKELNADYILCGNGQKIGTSIKISLELIETKTGYNLWTKPYLKEVAEDNIFDLQEEVALSVAEELEVYIAPEEKARIAKKPTNNKIAWDYYSKGIEEKGDSLQVAINYFEKALEHDNKFALAYAEISYCFYRLDYFQSDKIHLDLISEYADKALLYDSELDMGWITKGLFYYLKREFDLAVEYLKKALKYNPNSGLAIERLAFVYAHFLPNPEQSLEYALLTKKLNIEIDDNVNKIDEYIRLSQSFRFSGFFDEAEIYINRALEINPNNSSAIIEKSQLLPEMTGKYEMAKEILVELYEKDSTSVHTIRHLGLTCYMMRDFDGAYKYYKKVIEIKEAQSLYVYRGEFGRTGYLFKLMGENEMAEVCFERHKNYIENLEIGNVNKHHSFAAFYSYRGDTANAIKHLKILRQQENYPVYVIRVLEQDPLFDNVRELPEFKKIFSEIETKFWKNHDRIKASLKEKGLL